MVKREKSSGGIDVVFYRGFLQISGCFVVVNRGEFVVRCMAVVES